MIGHVSGLFLSVAAELTAAEMMPVKQAYDTIIPKDVQRVDTPVASLVMKAVLVGMSSSLLPVAMTFVVLLWTSTLSSSFGITVGALSVIVTCPMAMCYCSLQPVLASTLSMMQLTNRPEDAVQRAMDNASVGEQMTNAIRGFTAGSSSIVSFSLFIASARIIEVSSIDLMLDPQVLPGLLLGSIMPFVFSALTMMTLETVSKNIYYHVSSTDEDAGANILEVRECWRAGRARPSMEDEFSTSIYNPLRGLYCRARRRDTSASWLTMDLRRQCGTC